MSMTKEEEVLLTKKELAEKLSLSTRTIDRLRARGVDMGEVKLGTKTIRFKASTARKFLENGIKFNRS